MYEFQIGVTYNVDKAPTDNSFEVTVSVVTADNNEVTTRSCTKYTGDGDNSGMAILEFGLPSGFSLDPDEVNKVNIKIFKQTRALSGLNTSHRCFRRHIFS